MISVTYTIFARADLAVILAYAASRTGRDGSQGLE
jgi:hypothetical protein